MLAWGSPPTGRVSAQTDRAAAAFAELQRTADLVRVDGDDSQVTVAHGRNTRRAVALALVSIAAAGVAFGRAADVARADATADQDLFSLTNQDRASNGLHALLWHSTLSAIGENKPYGGCGFTVYGRSYDMIQRNYFAHPILNCGQYVFSMMSAAGIPYRSAGENIGWTAGAGDAAGSASYVNQQFMNSPEHRANILNTNYTHLGVGTDFDPGSWSGTSPAQSNVWMFSEEFAQLSTAAPPPPAPTPRPTQRPAPPQPTGQAAAQTPAPPTPVATVLPTPTPKPTPVPTPRPAPAPILGAPQPPLVWNGGGLIADSIESVLEAFLVD